MCLAIPSKIVKLSEFTAVVDVYSARREISLLLMPEEVGIGDYVLVHAGFAIQKVEHETAQETLRTISAVIEESEKEVDDDGMAE
ncbi:MAG: HypC/HybG/HupF family hydrogenase formation chaperone [Candidatus Sulfobium sp.]|jgi:hydrogenase expression/formation protein HypC